MTTLLFSCATNFLFLCNTQNVDIVVPFAVVFSDAGKASTIMLSNDAGDDCYVPIPTRIMDKLSSQVYRTCMTKFHSPCACCILTVTKVMHLH